MTSVCIIIFRFIVLTFPIGKIFKFIIYRDALMLGYFHYWLAFMSLTILIAAFYGTYEDLMCKSSAILNCFLIVNTLLVLQFIGSRKVFYFFIIFEVSIIPIFLIITG